jgi:DNA-binding Lrp family transcriptional regulator
MALLDVEVLCSFGSEMQRSLDQLIQVLRNLPGIFTVNVTGGEFQVGFGLQVRNLHELSVALDSLCTGAGIAFEKRSVAICTGWTLFTRKYMTSHLPKQKSFQVRSDVEARVIDATDKAIIAALKNAPLASFREISRAVGIAESTVVYRFNSLCEAGVIVGFGLSIDGTDIGMHTFRIVIRAANPTLSLRDSIYAFAARHPYVLSCSSYVGDWDYFLMVEMRAPLDVFALTRDLARAVTPHRIEVAVIPVLREIHFRSRPQ